MKNQYLHTQTMPVHLSEIAKPPNMFTTSAAATIERTSEVNESSTSAHLLNNIVLKRQTVRVIQHQANQTLTQTHCNLHFLSYRLTKSESTLRISRCIFPTNLISRQNLSTQPSLSSTKYTQTTRYDMFFTRLYLNRPSKRLVWSSMRLLRERLLS